ncbi:SIR2 family protein [Paenibacillus sp. VCA1]|uniref:SIR2 family protein n=1 Tax=Paenibacillus sp. VCA1 TaxID=3039148 RepID=UPI0028712816|nr:SIR2 family protein [Paenibacillus sp. VCA1]MDR9857674.1 SIR2 family protein [Paenibacillus sp. VCA1]
MDKDVAEFLKTFTIAIEESNVAIFAGAGLSKPAGFVNWKELLRDIADEINLDIDKESDLIAVAQYHVNENGGSRGKINQALIDEFTKDAEITENHKILSRLPISTYWTTNYDTLIEDALKSEGKRIDAKITAEGLAFTKPNSDARIYKMHGDISLPHEAVLTKDDYENYNIKRQLFTTALQGDLVSKTMLFIGFSFDDPNLEYILSRIRILLEKNQRTHYCFMKKVQRDDFKSESEFLYAEIKQNLKVNDLRRYSIKVLLVNQYEDITSLLKELEQQYKRRNIFVSGSASDYGTWGERRCLEFSSNLSKAIIKNGNNIVTGFGLGVGSCVISGALEEIYETRSQRVEERLISRPFPQNTTGQIPINELWTKHRNNMIQNVGISVFMFGNKIDSATGDIIDANGMIEEFEISLSHRVIPIPIGATGFTAKKIWETVLRDFDRYVPDAELKDKYQLLGDTSQTDEVLIRSVIEIVNKLEKRKK